MENLNLIEHQTESEKFITKFVFCCLREPKGAFENVRYGRFIYSIHLKYAVLCIYYIFKVKIFAIINELNSRAKYLRCKRVGRLI